MAGRKRQWLGNVLSYTLAGGAAGVAVGAALGALGGVLLPGRLDGRRLLAAGAVAFVALARELGWLSVPLPQLRRQTRDTWAKSFPGALAAALWGLDLGLVFTTWLTFAGVWLLAAVAFLAGEPGFGAALFGLYWLGRTLSVWLAPLWLTSASATPWLLDAIAGQRQLFQRLHELGLIWSLVVFITWFIHMMPPGG